MKRLIAPLVGVFLMGCGMVLPPVAPSGTAWGIPYVAEIVPDGSLDPLDGYAVGYRVRVEAQYAGNTFLIAHELAHVWQWHHKRMMSEWRGVPCAVQAADRCTAHEAHADAVATAAARAGCLPGDLGWPGAAPSGCRLPHPSEIHPPK